MRWLVLIAALACSAVGCGGADCSKSPNIQVTVAPDDDVPASAVVRLRVVLSTPTLMGTHDIGVGGSDPPLVQSGSTFLLQPDMAPSMPYTVSLVIQAYDAGGDLLAIGSDSMQAAPLGCNRMTVHLTALPAMSMPDMAAPPGSDLSGAMPADLSGCVGALPDEDADGRGNVCDLCPADYDPAPVDSDGDGLPDACDPNPTMGVNTTIYFDPFDASSGHWSGNNPITQSTLVLDAGGIGQVAASNATDKLPLLFRVQTYITPVHIYNGSSFINSGIYVGTSPDETQGDGVFCALSSNSNGPDTLDISGVHNGTVDVPTSQPLGGGLQSMPYRIRLTQRGGMWTCEALVGSTPVTTSTMKTVTAPLFITLHNDSMKSTFSSVFAASVLP